MIEYLNIYHNQRARRQLQARYWYNSTPDRSAATMAEFTTSLTAPQHSAGNVQVIVEHARRYDMDIMVIESNSIQFLARANARVALDQAFSPDWRQQFQQDMELDSVLQVRSEDSDLGQSARLHFYRDCVTVPKLQGVYEVSTGRRMTNRREIIERIWSWGFPTRRGRPLSVGQIRYSGNREELLLARDLYHQHYQRQNRSEVARKICQTYTSIQRYYAWPGDW